MWKMLRQNLSWKRLLVYFHFFKTDFTLKHLFWTHFTLNTFSFFQHVISQNQLHIPLVGQNGWCQLGERADNGYGERQKKKSGMSETQTKRVRVQSAYSRSVFDVSRVVPTCPAPLCQEITTLSPRCPTDCWEKSSVWCSKEGSPMQFSLSSLLFSFVCLFRQFHKSGLIWSRVAKDKWRVNIGIQHKSV